MFPKFVVLVTKNMPATPTTLEKNEVVAYFIADTVEDANQLAIEKKAEYRKLLVPAAQFGPGTPSVNVAIFVQQAPAPAAE